MVDLVGIQAAYYMVAATGVLVAAVFYVLNLREITKSRRITLTNTMMMPFMSEEGNRLFIDLVNMQWDDLDDFKRRYDSRTNPENYAKRGAMWNLCENFGRLYREGLIDLETLDLGSNGIIQYMWVKFKPVIEMYRRSDYGSHAYENFEYVAGQLEEFHKRKYGESYSDGERLERVVREHEAAQKTL